MDFFYKSEEQDDRKLAMLCLGIEDGPKHVFPPKIQTPTRDILVIRWKAGVSSNTLMLRNPSMTTLLP